MKALALATALSLPLTLTGCGHIYIAPDIEAQMKESNVLVVPLTTKTAQSANASRYKPKSLPAVFFQNAGTGKATRAASVIPTRLPPRRNQGAYEIGVGDVVVLATPQASSSIEELSGLLAAQNARQGYTVQDDGAIAVPNVGRVELAGLTLQEAETAVFQALVSAQLDPTFSIEVAEFNSKRVTVSGDVAKPQTLPITLAPLTLLEAVTSAGGATALDTQIAAVRIFRDDDVYQVPLEDLQKLKVTLQAGDSVVVESGPQIDKALQVVNAKRDALTEARANFQARLAADAVDRDFVYLMGEVKEQGRFPLPFGRQASLADALFSGGGTLPITGNPAEIYLLRGDASEQVTAFHLDGRNPAKMIAATQLELRPNDLIFVAQQPVTRWNRALNQIGPSLVISGTNAISN